MMNNSTDVSSDVNPGADSISVVDLIRVNIRFILTFTIVCTLVIAVYSIFMRQTFQSNAKILAADSKSSTISTMLSGIPSFITGGSGSGNTALSMAEILTSRTNAEYIIKKCGLDTVEPYRSMSHEERRATVLEQLAVDAKRSSGVITVECSVGTGLFPSAEEQSRIANLAARVCNTAIEGLDIANREKSTSTARKTRIYIERVLATNRVRLDSFQHAMVSFQNEHHVFTPEKQADAMVSSAVSIGTELSKAETELRLAREQFQDNTPLIGALESKVQSLRSQFASIQSGGLSASDKLSIPVDVLPDLSMRYLNLVRDIKILEQVNAYLESQRMQEAVQEERDVPTIQVVDPAVAAEKRSSPSRVWMVVLGLVVSFLLGIVVVAVRRAVSGWRSVVELESLRP